MALVQDITNALDTLAPLSYAEAWDNVGLLVGRREEPVSRVLLTIDLTEAVLAEAIEQRAQMIVAYHPPVFHALKRVTEDSWKARIVLDAIAAGIAVHSPHTALDAAPGGVNDWLCSIFGTGDVRALQAHDHLPRSEAYKIVTFCPAEAADHIRSALASIGAGRIGAYEHCSFELRGTGTFLGGAGTSPAIGKSGELERVDEVRLEMVCPEASLALATVTLRGAHPYEEPPIEIHPLRARPHRDIGAGRRLVLDHGDDAHTLARRLKDGLGSDQLRLAMPDRVATDHTIRTIGLCAGSGGALLESALEQGCELFLTGELDHHACLDALARGCAVIVTGHTNTERGYLPVLRERLTTEFDDYGADVEFTVSQRDVFPFRAI